MILWSLSEYKYWSQNDFWEIFRCWNSEIWCNLRWLCIWRTSEKDLDGRKIWSTKYAVVNTLAYFPVVFLCDSVDSRSREEITKFRHFDFRFGQRQSRGGGCRSDGVNFVNFYGPILCENYQISSTFSSRAPSEHFDVNYVLLCDAPYISQHQWKFHLNNSDHRHVRKTKRKNEKKSQRMEWGNSAWQRKQNNKKRRQRWRRKTNENRTVCFISERWQWKSSFSASIA